MLSFEPEAIIVPLGLIATSRTAYLCPTNLNGLICGLKFHTDTVQSKDEETAYFILGLKTTPVIAPFCPLKLLFKAGSLYEDLAYF